ncbi:glycosyltransferase family 2 protein [bacterium]|nr:glycosyltransferase family 2 protein [bacterium]
MLNLRVIIPAYNEEDCINDFYNNVEPYLKSSGFEYEYLFVDDGSKDGTLNKIKELREKDPKINYISFSRNFGKENAMYAGLKESLDFDAVIIIDADLQHPPYLISEMVSKYNEGYKIIYTKQNSRKKEGFGRKLWARMFYSFFNKHADVPIEQSTKDFMMVDKQVVKAFVEMPDEFRFMKGLLSFVGYKKYCLEFEYVDRTKGKSKWNFKKLFKYGISGLNEFSSFFLVVPVVASIISFLSIITTVVLEIFGIFNSVDTFIILLILSILMFVTNISLYFVLYVLYSTRKEAMKRPLYFIEESSLGEKDV